jgi:hypothetical protein
MIFGTSTAPGENSHPGKQNFYQLRLLAGLLEFKGFLTAKHLKQVLLLIDLWLLFKVVTILELCCQCIK